MAMSRKHYRDMANRFAEILRLFDAESDDSDDRLRRLEQ